MQTILLPVVADPPPFAAAQRAAWLARRNGARVLLLHVVPPEDAVWEEFPAALMPLFDGLAVTVLLRRGLVAREILAAARDENADLILMTRHGRWTHASALGFPRFLLHSVVSRVLLDALCPVWVEPESDAPPEIRRVLYGVASLVHDRDMIVRAGGLAADMGSQLALLRCAINAAIAVPGQRQWSATMQKEVVAAAKADLEKLRAELAVTGETCVGIGGFVPTLLQDAQPADLIAVRRTSRDWSRDETLNPLVRGAAGPVLVYPGEAPRPAARAPVRILHPRVARWAAPVLFLVVLLSAIWLMHTALGPMRGADCKAQPDRCPVLNGFLNTAKERGSAGK